MNNQPLSYEDYESICDKIYSSGKLSLNFNVVLYYKSREGKRIANHSEVEYSGESKGYTNGMTLRKINRRINSYLLFSIKDFNSGLNQSIMIGMADMLLFRAQLNNISNKILESFKMNNNGKIHIVKKEDPQVLTFHNNWIQFQPIVIRTDNDGDIRGVRISINNYETFEDISLDSFYAYKYIIDSFDMYNNSIILLNYLGRPEFGYNSFNPQQRHSQVNNNSPF